MLFSILPAFTVSDKGSFGKTWKQQRARLAGNCLNITNGDILQKGNNYITIILYYTKLIAIYFEKERKETQRNAASDSVMMCMGFHIFM